ncbi:MAG: cytochrome c biogenesis protein ResB [Verrucomicrobiota bacterium]
MAGKKQKSTNPAQWLLRFFSSFGLATVVLFLMCVVTLFGTLAQVEMGIYEAQKKYFESFFVVHWLGPVPGKGLPLPLPGGLLLMILLFINLAVGTALKVRKKWKQPGLLIAHLGILFLLLGGFVTFKYSTKGAMVLYEGQTSDLFSSYHDWQIEVAKVVGENEIGDHAFVIEKAQLKDMRPDEQRVFTSEDLPFDVVINGYARNSMVLPADIPIAQSSGSKEVDGYIVQPAALDPEAARNIPGAYVGVRSKSGGEEEEVILWGFARHPATVPVGDDEWTFQLIKERWKAPFEVKLDKFTHEYHPKTQIPRVYQSDVTKFEGDLEEEYEISMNRPLRHEGYTFYQESWGPEGAQPGDQVWSQLAVSKNPADQWPMWSCWVVGIGLLIHFLQKLGGYLGRAQRKGGAASA